MSLLTSESLSEFFLHTSEYGSEAGPARHNRIFGINRRDGIHAMGKMKNCRCKRNILGSHIDLPGLFILRTPKECRILGRETNGKGLPG